jgi:hypothetical protein
VIYSFTDFYRHVIGDLKQAPAEIHCRLDFLNLHERDMKTVLGPFSADSYAAVCGHELHEAPEDGKTWTSKFAADRYDPAVVAYELIREVYIWFGIDEDEIPYVKKVGNVQVVDVEAIQNIQ